jgi:hypothetical protein
MTHRTRTTHALIATLAVALAATLTSIAIARPMLTPGTAAAADGANTSMVAGHVSEVEPTLHQLNALRAVLAPFEHVEAALDGGFERFGHCMSGPQGAQGIHFTHAERIGDPTLDLSRPEVLMYEPRPDGSLRLIGTEYLVFQQAWHEAGNGAPPSLLGREFTLNTTLLDEPFYALHVWVWQHNPLGIFANWNPLVNCEHEEMEGG